MNSVPTRTLSNFRQFLKELKYAPVETLLRRFAVRGRQAGWLGRYQARRRARFPKQVAALQSILAENRGARAVFLFPPSLDWQRQLFQRPQQLARALAQQGALVLYCQLSPPEGGDGFVPFGERLYVCALPLEIFSIIEQPMVYCLAWNRKYLLKLAGARVVYDNLDAVEAFAGDHQQLTRDHQALLREAELVLSTARRLYEEVQSVRPDALYVPNGVEFDHFARPSGEVPADLEPLRRVGKPIAGYYGALAEWFDYPLLAELAQRRPDLQFVLIGPKHDGSLDASGLLRLDNIHYLGPKPYAQLPDYLTGFDVALLPFRVNTITQSTSPIKLFEYLAGGKPVVSTPLREVLPYDQVFTAGDAGTFSAAVDQALLAREEPGFSARLRETARQNTWAARAEMILAALEQRHAHPAL